MNVEMRNFNENKKSIFDMNEKRSGVFVSRNLDKSNFSTTTIRFRQCL